ncbi:DNA repair protein RadC [Candidatus Kaiserbacteria bacterium]|nr:DNA repair protein RadC [Candidatus Kaiserbacteria bacterium]
MTAFPYTIQNRDLILDNPSGQYVLRVRDLAQEDKPRERLVKDGPAALSSNELLAVLLVTGTTKEGILQMTSRIIAEYGEKSIFARTDAKTLSSDLDIPLTKAAQIVVAGELGRRFYQRSGSGAIIRAAADVFAYVADMRSLTKEHMRGIYLNTHYQVVHDEVISIGTVDANIVHPREVFKPALQYSAAGVVLVHNHPSGVVTPSAMDLVITSQLKEAGRIFGIDLIDHVIVTADGFSSIIAG